MSKKNLKSCSKEIYSLTHEGNPTLEEVNASCLMRIADATELIAINYAKMQKDLEFYESGYRRRGAAIGELERSNSGLRGVITRMKNKNNDNKN